jgi:hypothetical protein
MWWRLLHCRVLITFSPAQLTAAPGYVLLLSPVVVHGPTTNGTGLAMPGSQSRIGLHLHVTIQSATVRVTQEGDTGRTDS